jgi:hypothetical protein
MELKGETKYTSNDWAFLSERLQWDDVNALFSEHSEFMPFLLSCLAEAVLGVNASCTFLLISFPNFSSWLTSLKTLSLLVFDFFRFG